MSRAFLMRLALIGAASALPVLALAAPKAKPAAAPAAALAPAPAMSWRTPDPDNLLVIDTTKGRIIVELYPQAAPVSVERIKVLAKRHFYDGQQFFRVIDGFMAQTGDPQNSGQGGSDLPNVKGEFGFRRGADLPFVLAVETAGQVQGFVGALPVAGQSDGLMAMTADGKVNAWGLFCTGVAGMARAEDPDSGNSQFFLMRDTFPSLNRKYTPWGRVVVGEAVVQALKAGEPPTPPLDKMTVVRLASDLPAADRPKVEVADTQSAGFRAALAKTLADKGAAFSVCDVEVPARLAP